MLPKAYKTSEDCVPLKTNTTARMHEFPVDRHPLPTGTDFVVHFKKKLVNPYVSSSPRKVENRTYKSQIWPEQDTKEFTSARMKTSNQVEYKAETKKFLYRTHDASDLQRRIDVEEARSNVTQDDKSTVKTHISGTTSQLSKSRRLNNGLTVTPRNDKSEKSNPGSPRDRNLEKAVDFDPDNKSLDLDAPSQRGANYGSPAMDPWRHARGLHTLELEPHAPLAFIPGMGPQASNYPALTQSQQSDSRNGVQRSPYGPDGRRNDQPRLSQSPNVGGNYDRQEIVETNKGLASYRHQLALDEDREKYMEEKFGLAVVSAVTDKVQDDNAKKREMLRQVDQYNQQTAKDNAGVSRTEQARQQRERIEAEAASYMERIAKDDHERKSRQKAYATVLSSQAKDSKNFKRKLDMLERESENR
jgi:hypothetical protein